MNSVLVKKNEAELR